MAAVEAAQKRHLGTLHACDHVGCMQLTREQEVALTTGPTGALLADVLVATGQLTHLQLGGVDVFSPEPIALQDGRRVQLFLALDPQTGWTFAAANEVALDARLVALFQPGTPLSIRSSGGAEVELPATASPTAFVVGVTELDVGGLSPHVSLTPPRTLDAPALVRLPLEPRRIPRGLRTTDYHTSTSGVLAFDAEGRSAQVRLGRLDDVRLVTDRPFVETAQGDAWVLDTPNGQPIDKAATSACANALASNLVNFNNALAQTQAIRISACEGVFPYVHIVMANLGLPGLPATKRYPWVQIAASKTAQGPYLLRTLASHVSGWAAFTGINGFVWSGDEVTADNQLGTLNGTVYLAGTKVNNTTGAEAIVGFTTASDKGTGAKLFDRAANTNPNLSPFNYYATGSTTSIIKNGGCSRTDGDGPENLWSAMGIGGKRLVMVSSVTGQDSTEAFDLCAVFQALQATEGAIRLDGGPSAAIYWNGTHLNPLSGARALKYGSARRRGGRLLHPIYPLGTNRTTRLQLAFFSSCAPHARGQVPW